MHQKAICNATTGVTEFIYLTDAEFAALQPTSEEVLEQARKTAKQNRLYAYVAEADPLFFKWQRGEGTEQAWLDKVSEIRDRYPNIEAP